MGLKMSMSIAGSVVLILYILLKPITKKIFSAKWRYNVLQISLFFFLIPFQLIKLYYGYNIENDIENNVINLSSNIIRVSSDGNLNWQIDTSKIVLMVFCTIIGISIFGIGTMLYFKQKKRVMKVSEIISDSDLINVFVKFKKKLKIKRKILYKISSVIMDPLTIGVVQPIIVLPNQKYSKQELNFICEHELLHIKNNNTLFKIISLWVIVLNWFNPLVYFLFWELDFLSEIVCDESIVSLLEREQRICYGNLILKILTKKKESAPIFITSFSNDKKRVENRMKLMMNVKKMKRGIKILSVCILFFLGIASSFTAFAYDSPTIMIVSTPDVEDKNSMAGHRSTTFVTDDILNEGFIKNEKILQFYDTKIPLESYFQDEVGNIYPINEDTIKKGCAHSYVNGKVNEHVKNGNSCNIYVYDAKRCSKCGLVVRGELISKTEYPKCIH